MPCRAMDSTGIKVEGEGEWHARKHGGPKRRVWRKSHIGDGERRSATGSSAALTCYPTCSTRSRRTSRSAVSPPTVPTTLASATMPSRIAAPMRSFRLARTRSLGRPSLLGLQRATRPCGHRNTLAAPCGDDGVDIAAGAASRRRCIV